MDIKSEISWIKKELNKVQDPDFIQTVKSMLQNREKVTKAYLEAYNNDISLAEEDIENGYVHDHDDVAKKIQEWKKR